MNGLVSAQAKILVVRADQGDHVRRARCYHSAVKIEPDLPEVGFLGGGSVVVQASSWSASAYVLYYLSVTTKVPASFVTGGVATNALVDVVSRDGPPLTTRPGVVESALVAILKLAETLANANFWYNLLIGPGGKDWGADPIQRTHDNGLRRQGWCGRQRYY